MKPVIFTEEQFSNLNEVGKNLFTDEQDPRSLAYVRKLKRPKINWIRIVAYIVLPILVLSVLVMVLNYFGLSIATAVGVSAIILIVYIVLTLKQAVICVVKIYQRYAPDSIRNKCRFEPSCSEYMLLAIEKYGLIKGVKKGICRMKRCNTDDGGYDFP